MKFAKVKLSYVLNGTDIKSLTLPLGSASEGYTLQGVDGLSPTDIAVGIAQSRTGGGFYQGSNPALRQIVMLLGFAPDYSQDQSIADLRNNLYVWLTPPYDLPVTFSLLDKDDNFLASTSGYVTKFEQNIFSQEPQVQITIDCINEYLQNWGLTYTRTATPTLTIPNIGNAPSGFSMKITKTATAPGFDMYDAASIGGSYSKGFRLVYSFLKGDVISFDTTPGQRFATLTRGTTVTNLLNNQQSTSQWLQLTGGNNVFHFGDTNFTINNITVNANYWGV